MVGAQESEKQKRRLAWGEKEGELPRDQQGEVGWSLWVFAGQGSQLCSPSSDTVLGLGILLLVGTK